MRHLRGAIGAAVGRTITTTVTTFEWSEVINCFPRTKRFPPA